MSDRNPYAPAATSSIAAGPIRKVEIRPIELLRRSYELIRDQYWLFLGITLAGLIIAGVVPFGLLAGPMFVGMFLCYLAKERGTQVEFAWLFRGFDSFAEALIATLIYIGFSLVVLLPVVGLFVLVMVAALSAGGGDEPSAGAIAVMLFLYPIIILVSLVTYLPFLFVFQLMADRQLQAIPAIKLSLEGALKNLWGIVWYLIVMMVLGFIAALMCYIPAILLMPIMLGAAFLLYRDIYGPSLSASSVPVP